MKKLIMFLAILALSQCQIGPKEAFAQTSVGRPGSFGAAVKTWTTDADGMTYRIFSYGDAVEAAAICVINVTRERLEVEKLRLEVRKLQRDN